MIKINGIEINAFVDFGNGFKFIIDSVEINEIECYGVSWIFKVNPKSLDWVKIEELLENQQYENQNIKKEESNKEFGLNI